MSKFLHSNNEDEPMQPDNHDVKTIAIPWVSSKNSPAKNIATGNVETK